MDREQKRAGAEQIARVEHYELLLDELLAALREPKTLSARRETAEALAAYYASEAWKEDFAADEAGRFPATLKRGVLSEDEIYNALEAYREALEEERSRYRVVDPERYYRKGVYRHFTKDCKCSTSMTARIDVTALAERSKRTGTKFYLNFLYLLAKTLNSREDYRMGYLWQTDELICYDAIHPTQYVFHEDTETCTPVYTLYCEDYAAFYRGALEDLSRAKETRDYLLDAASHPNWFDASYISWLSYDSLNIELPDGYLYFAPIVNWGRYREENGRLLMPVTVRLNHAVADGYLLALVFRLLQREIERFCGEE